MLVAVPCAGADCVVLLDGDDGTERGRIAVGDHPVHLAAVGSAVFVATMGERAVSVVDDGRVGKIETGILGPSHFALADGLVLVPCTGGDAVAILDPDSRSLAGRVGVGAEPHDAAVRDGLAYVGSRVDGTVSVVDPDAARVKRTIDVGADARVQGVDAGFGAVYAVDQTGGRVVRADETDVTARADVGANPYEATLGPERVYVAGRDDGTVTSLAPDLSDPETHGVGGRPTAVSIVDGAPWVLDRERARMVALDADASLSLPAPAFAADPVGDGDAVAVSHYDDDRVSLVSTADREVRWTAETPAQPFEPLVL
ncbi:MAG: YncE family protein [Halobellus sp.]